jgi:hypothetical protein
MKLLYVDEWEMKRNSPRLKDDSETVDNSEPTSPKNGTGTSPKNGTLKSKEEYTIRNIKAFNNVKSKNQPHEFAQSMNQAAHDKKQTTKFWEPGHPDYDRVHEK